MSLPLHHTGPLPGSARRPSGRCHAGGSTGRRSRPARTGHADRGRESVAGSAPDMTDFDTSPPSPALAELARAYDVSTEYWDWRGRHVLRLGGDHPGRAARLRGRCPRRHRGRGRAGRESSAVVAADAAAGRGDAGGRGRPGQGARRGRRPGAALGRARGRRPGRPAPGGGLGAAADDRRRERRRGDLRAARPSCPSAGIGCNAETPQGISTVPLVVTPDRVALPERAGRTAGLGLHDPALLGALQPVVGDRRPGRPGRAGRLERASLGADYVLVNPLSAASPVAPMEPSPYLPTTRRFVNPVYLRVEDVREVAYMSSAERQLLEWHADDAHQANDSDRIDRDAVWAAKSAALEIVHRLPRSPARAAGLRRLPSAAGQRAGRLRDLVRAGRGPRRAGGLAGRRCADPHSPEVAAERARLADRVDFHSLAAVGGRRPAGLRAAHGAAAPGWGWASSRTCRSACTRAAPMPGPSRTRSPSASPSGRRRTSTTRSARTGASRRCGRTGWPSSATARSATWSRTVLRHAGGVRVDHVIGLFRLWWVPEGQPADQGTYVRYDHEALVGILALEAQRAGAVVIGEDLGTVEPWVRDYLRDRGIFGTSILWFEKDAPGPAAGAGALSRAVPGHGHHARPAADRGIPCGRAHPAAGRARAC